MSDRENRTKKPWPTKAAMEQIYEKNLWGGDKSDFYSGAGSHEPELVNPYIEVLRSFLDSFDSPLIVCDLGCGDFNVGKKLVNYCGRYIGVDIVPDLIERNKEEFRKENLDFYCLDIAKDELPSADCVILRLVLQHLSNEEVQAVVNKLHGYKYVLVTEHIPEGDFIPNKDIISGQGIRLKKQSGIDLLASPFNLEVVEEEQLLVLKPKDHKGIILTMLYRMF